MNEPRFDHSGMAILGDQKCRRILHDQSLGRIGFVDEEGEPTVLPVAYRFHSGRIVFLSSEGNKLRAAARGERVCFQVDGWDPDAHTGWSVLVRGLCRAVPDEEAGRLSDVDLRPWLRSVLRPMRWIEVIPDEITGRRLPGALIPPDWD